MHSSTGKNCPLDTVRNGACCFSLTHETRKVNIVDLLSDFREQLQRNAREGRFYIKVNMQLLLNFDESLGLLVRNNPETLLPVLESATKKVYQNNYHETISGDASDPVPEWQVQIYSEENPRILRDLTSKLVGKLICVPGIITSASRTSIKAISITWKCSACDHTYS